jgi:hypothetical protein
MPYSEKSLFQLKSFHFALWSPIFFAGLFIIYIMITSDLNFKGGFLGLNNAWDIFKVPLAIFSLIFPCVALVTANHRSTQSKKLIELTAKQNIFKNYYDSINDFEKYLESFTYKKYFSYKNKRVLYQKIFPLNSSSSIETTINKKRLSELKTFYQNVVDSTLSELCSDKYLKKYDVYLEKYDVHSIFPFLIINDLYKRLEGNWLINFGVEVNVDIFHSSDSIVNIINSITDEFYSLLSYCMEYSKTENGITICPHNSFVTSHSWQEFKTKIENKFHLELELDSIKF